MAIRTFPRVAQAFVIVSIILLIVYGADVALKTYTVSTSNGFLLLSDMVRGLLFGGVAVGLSTAAYFISWKTKSWLVSILLVINGILVVIGGAGAMGLMTGATKSAISASSAIIIGLGIWLIALGIWKSRWTAYVSSHKVAPNNNS